MAESRAGAITHPSHVQDVGADGWSERGGRADNRHYYHKILANPSVLLFHVQAIKRICWTTMHRTVIGRYEQMILEIIRDRRGELTAW